MTPRVGRERRHYTYTWQRQSAFDEQAILNDLPEYIRSDVAMWTNRHTISSISFLSDLSPQALTALCVHFHPLTSPPGDHIITEGETGSSFYCLSTGQCEVLLQIREEVSHALDIEDFLVLQTIGPGGSFAEYAILSTEKHTHPFTVRVLDTYAELITLSRESYEAIYNLFPQEIGDCFQKLAIARLGHLRELLKSKDNVKAVTTAADARDSFKDAQTRATTLWGAARGIARDASGDTLVKKAVSTVKLADFRRQRKANNVKIAAEAFLDVNKKPKDDGDAASSKAKERLAANISIQAKMWTHRAKLGIEINRAITFNDQMHNVDGDGDGDEESDDANDARSSLSCGPQPIQKPILRLRMRRPSLAERNASGMARIPGIAEIRKLHAKHDEAGARQSALGDEVALLHRKVDDLATNVATLSDALHASLGEIIPISKRHLLEPLKPKPQVSVDTDSDADSRADPDGPAPAP